MSALRQRLRRPQTYLLALLILVLLGAADALRPPDRQLSARIYLAAVHNYQHHGHGITHRFAHCRYTPTCSAYSVEAVRRYGIVRGLVLTARRVWSCRTSVPFGTIDPVPIRD